MLLRFASGIFCVGPSVKGPIAGFLEMTQNHFDDRTFRLFVSSYPAAQDSLRIMIFRKPAEGTRVVGIDLQKDVA